MFGIPGPIGTLLDLFVVILGFGLIVFLHECGHFFAARWAGIRVLAFAMGMGPAIVSYRKGMGWRRGTSEPDYRKMVTEAASTGRDVSAISPTEYRLNVLPIGGYVKMLGQDDLNPEAVSTASDSYQSCKPVKRMVVISAGVVMNIITAAVLFVIVFMVGLSVEPPVVGEVAPGSPAALAAAGNADIGTVGLLPGDVIEKINGRSPNTFADVRLGVAMTERDAPVHLVVQRPGVDGPLEFAIVPEVSELDRLLSIGISAPVSLTLSDIIGPAGEVLPASFGLSGLAPGSTVVAADGKPVKTLAELNADFAASDGRPLRLSFEQAGETVERTVEPRAELQYGMVPGSAETELLAVEHLLGLTPVMRVDPGPNGVNEQGAASGLKPGDIFAEVDGIEYPSLVDGIRRIRANRGRDIGLVVLREVDGKTERVSLTAHVSSSGPGRIGFTPSDTADESTVVAMPPLEIRNAGSAASETPPAASVITAPGQRVVAVEGTPVSNFAELRTALQRATASAAGSAATVRLTIGLPLVGGEAATVERDWTLEPSAIAELQGLRWTAPFSSAVFEPEEVELRASGPGQAISFGLSETRRVLVTTYVTFVRLFERTVKIEHLKGPVGIAHIGTILADRGFIWVVFFMAVISVNLAVINFLPLPIVDGGQFLMLVYEQIRGRPVPIGFQNVVTMAGLLLIVSLFLVVTFNDVRNLLGF